MKIWLINQYAIPPHEPGGTRHYSHARELIKRGHEVWIVATNFHHMSRKTTPLSPGAKWEEQHIGGVPFVFLPSPEYQDNSVRRWWNMAAFSRAVLWGEWSKKLPKPDVILGSSPHPFGALAAERLAKRLSVPFVLEVRDLWPQALIDVAGLSPRNPAVTVVGWLEKYLYRVAKRIVMFSPSGADRVRETGNDPNKVVWIPNGVDLGMSPEPTAPVDGREFSVVYIGAHGVANALDCVLDAAKLVQAEAGRQISFRLVGKGPEKARLEARAKDEDIRNVKFESPVPKTDVPRVLQGADVLVLSAPVAGVYSTWMGFNKLYDYLASGRPVVFACNAERTPVHESGAGFCVPAEDGQALAETILKLSKMTAAERWQMGSLGRKFIDLNHNIKFLAERLEATLRQGIESSKTNPQRGWRGFIKRAVDFVCAGMGLVAVSPVLAVAALAIWGMMGGPVLFRQERPGKCGRPFRLMKFRTMTEAKDADGRLLDDGARLTRLGRWLRACSVDELPQLWNVVKGEMSLVGPRPLLMEYMERYTAEQARRHEVMPGITGWAQVNGRNAVSWEEKFAADVWYVEHWGLWLDAKILAMTALSVVRREGISREGHATMPKFMGRRTEETVR